MTTLVTGATGLLGNNVVRRLLEEGRQVRVLVRGNAQPQPLDGLEVEIARGDVRDADAVAAACRDAKVIVHCAGIVHIGWSNADLHREVNVEGSRNVALAAREAQAQMIHVSSVDALGLGTLEQPADEDTTAEPSVPCPYVISKREAERVILELTSDGLNALIVNPAYMLGPWDWKPSSGRMLLEVARRFTPLAPPGGNNFCDVRDVAGGVLAAVDRGEVGRRYILGGEALSYFEAWKMFARITGARGPIGRLGPLQRVAVGAWGDFRTWIGRPESDLNSAAIRIASLPHYFNSARAMNEIGYNPRPAEEAARAAWDWFVEYGYAKRN